jgi:hypothetical protein
MVPVPSLLAPQQQQQQQQQQQKVQQQPPLPALQPPGEGTEAADPAYVHL